jgi:hypothetical protein
LLTECPEKVRNRILNKTLFRNLQSPTKASSFTFVAKNVSSTKRARANYATVCAFCVSLYICRNENLL